MQGLATLHRPRKLADLVGQRHVTAVLKRALQNDRLPQQLLFSGGSGLGKTTVARVVAAALLCENPQDGDACAACDSCLDIFEPSRAHPDVVEFDAASNGQKEQIRELAARALTAPVRGKYRVYIIDEAHGLSQGGGQAFLKLLEEPPAHVIFMLATTDPEKMLRTNRGRCVEFELARPSNDELAEHLVSVAASHGWELSRASADAVLTATDPALGVRGLLMTLEKLSDLLSWGTQPTIDEVTTLLGLPPTAQLDALWAAVCAYDKNRALAELDTLRKRSSDASIRRALVARAREALTSALAMSSGDVELWRFETLLTSPSGQLWTDLAVARIAQLHAGEQTATEALLRDALDAAARLRGEVRAVAEAMTAPAPETGEAPLSDADAPSDDHIVDATLADAPLEQDPSTDAAALVAPLEPAEDPVDAPVAATESPAALTERLMTLVASRNKVAAAILRTCKLHQHGTTLRVEAPSATVARLRQHAPDVRAAAAECGVTLTISSPEPASQPA